MNAVPAGCGDQIEMTTDALGSANRRLLKTKKHLLLSRQVLLNFVVFGSSTWARTRDLRINSPALYQLSY
jgi:hypothetical protein